MNILDFPDTEIPDTDLLKAIFDKQSELMTRYHDIESQRGALVVAPENFGDIDSREVQWRIKDLAFRTIEEMTEATNCLKNKPWKVSEVMTDRDHFYEELADALHFFVELLITAGLDAEDIALLYLKKAQVNEFRQRTKY